MKDFNTSGFRDNLVKSQEKKGRKKDTRYLNFYELDFGQSLTVRFFPDNDPKNPDMLWNSYKNHGGEFKDRRISTINCSYSSSEETCPSCIKYFGLYDEEGMRDESFKWKSKEHVIAQCIVIDAPKGFEVDESPDGNLIKLINLPFAIKDDITESIMSGEIDNPTDHDYIIKKTKNAGGRASYVKSRFNDNEADLPESFVESIKKGESYLYDISTFLPEATTAKQVEEWLGKTEAIQNENFEVGTTGTTTQTAGEQKLAELANPVITPASSKEEAGEPKEKPKLKASEMLANLSNRDS